MSKKIDEKQVYHLISGNIKRLRALHDLSQLDLAVSTGLTHNFINDIENCKKGISARSLAKLSNAFNVEPYQLLLPDSMHNSDMISYVKDFNDSLQKVVSDLTEQYLTKDKKDK